MIVLLYMCNYITLPCRILVFHIQNLFCIIHAQVVHTFTNIILVAFGHINML